MTIKNSLFYLFLACFVAVPALGMDLTPNPDTQGNTQQAQANEQLFKHVALGNLQGVQKALQEGANINARDTLNPNGTPLMVAIMTHKEDVAQYLINQNPTLNLTDKDGKTALHYAITYQYVNIATQLVQRMPALAQQKTSLNQTLLHLAVITKNIDVVRYVIDSDAYQININDQDNTGNTALHCAEGLPLQQYLVNQGARENIENSFKQAAGWRYRHNLSFQQPKNARRNQNNPQHKVPREEKQKRSTQYHKDGALLRAAQQGNLTGVQEALSNGANINAKWKNSGKTALHYAVTRKPYNMDMIEALIAADINPNEPDNDGITPLHAILASIVARKDIPTALAIELILVNNGAEINDQIRGLRTYSIAAEKLEQAEQERKNRIEGEGIPNYRPATTVTDDDNSDNGPKNNAFELNMTHMGIAAGVIIGCICVKKLCDWYLANEKDSDDKNDENLDLLN